MTRISILAHNIRSLWNVGSLFRTADAFHVSSIYLTGYTAVPPREEISKTALGAEEWIPWTYQEDPLSLIAELKKNNITILALEKTETSIPLSEYQADGDVCLILGHEVQGVNDDLLSAADQTVHIPMLGKKESLNVSVATGIALYSLACLQG